MRHPVLASGPLPDHDWPAIRGLDTYDGHKIHSARWDHDYDFTGKRVAVIGTGASAIQIIPELVKQAEFVKVFQRTPGWVLPRLDVATPAAAQALFAKVPAAQQLARQALFWGHEISATALVWDTPVTGLVARLGKAHDTARSKIRGCGASSPRTSRRAASGCSSPATTTPRCSATTASSSTGSSWYLTADGFNAAIYPGFATQYLRQMREFRFADYDADAQTVSARVRA